MKIMIKITVEMKIEKAPVTDGIDEDDCDENARDKKLTSLSSACRCYQRASPPFENWIRDAKLYFLEITQNISAVRNSQ